MSGKPATLLQGMVYSMGLRINGCAGPSDRERGKWAHTKGGSWIAASHLASDSRGQLADICRGACEQRSARVEDALGG